MHVSDCVATVLQPLDYSAQDLNTQVRRCYLNILAVGMLVLEYLGFATFTDSCRFRAKSRGAASIVCISYSLISMKSISLSQIQKETKNPFILLRVFSS